MAEVDEDEEDAAGAIRHAKERWSLLFALKCTVESILTSDSQSSIDTNDRFNRVRSDLERIIKHGLVSCIFIFIVTGHFFSAVFAVLQSSLSSDKRK